MKSLRIKCEECGRKFTDETGRNYERAYGGGIFQVCDLCAKKFREERGEE
jgi:hypothetical protein